MNRLRLITLVALGTAAVLGLWFLISRPEPAERRQTSVVVLPLRTFSLNLDPASMADIDSRKVATLLYTGLVAVDPDGTVRPRLARSWSRSRPDTIEFTLADGVTFPDGSPLTAERVVASLCASMQPSHIQSWSLASIAHRVPAGSKAVECTGLQVRGASVVSVREERPTPWLMEALAGPGGWIVDTRHRPGAYGIRAGTGPYVVKAVLPDSRIDLAGRARGAITPRVERIQFRYVADDALAASNFNTGQLDFLEIDTPQLQQLVGNKEGELLRRDSRVLMSSVERVRVVVFNMQRLQRIGRGAGGASFIASYFRAVPRAQIAGRSLGLAEPLESSFPPSPNPQADVAAPALPANSPGGAMTLLTESDPYSDLIASQLPGRVGSSTIRYRTVDRGTLIGALLKGNFDAALIKVEATHHIPKFWAAFFTPGDPYVAFGTPIAGLTNLDLASSEGLARTSALINSQGNWVPVLRERGRFAHSSRMHGIRFTASGQLSFEEISVAP
jgi:hypothetical protein